MSTVSPWPTVTGEPPSQVHDPPGRRRCDRTGDVGILLRRTISAEAPARRSNNRATAQQQTVAGALGVGNGCETMRLDRRRTRCDRTGDFVAGGLTRRRLTGVGGV